jgi:uncharacterized protein HemX
VNRLRSAASGAVLGLAALVLVSAILGGALASFRSSQVIDRLSGRLDDARSQIDSLHADNERLAEQNRKILAQNKALVRYLRRHGLAVPKAAETTPVAPTSSGEEVTAPSPKASPEGNPSPSPRRPLSPPPGSQAPTAAPGPTVGPITLAKVLCGLTPMLCTLVEETG